MARDAGLAPIAQAGEDPFNREHNKPPTFGDKQTDASDGCPHKDIKGKEEYIMFSLMSKMKLCMTKT